ncbi:MAG: glycoside hydrolase family 3 C-terminal domain-containing protein [Aerococcaceae bacterium]|nr:glycoside hydrolase family 3 C-terminal domain-containing protein [Aerococcaceae bacterium]
MKHQAIIDQMSLFEKALLLTGKNTWQTKDYPQYNVPSIFLSDGPHGIRKQLGEADHLGLNASIPSTCFPTAATVANSWDIDLAKEIGIALGEEANDLGVNVILGPGMNIKRNPLCGRNFEYFSEDPVLTGEMATAYVQGIQSQGVSACPKHFAVNSQELRRMSNDSIVDERALREIYLQAFEMVVKKSAPKFMMTSYNQVNGTYTNEHHHLLQEILYGEWNYNGAIVTDWGGSNDHVQGVIEGSHLEMPGTGIPSAIELQEAVAAGRLSEDVINQRVDELLDVIFTLAKDKGVSTNALTPAHRTEHHTLANRAAAESIVLLKNDRNLLPLSSEKTIAIIGDFAQTPRYQGAGSSVVNPTQLETIMSTKADFGYGEVPFAQGYHRSGKVDAALITEAVTVAQQVEVPLLFIGLTEITESEGMDRSTMQLDRAQLDLVDAVTKANPNTVVVLSGGSVIEMPFASQVSTIVHGYLGGQAGASAVWKVLTGVVNPSGKLAETYPLNYEDVSSAHYYPGLERTSEYRESIYVGYRHYDTIDKAVQFPFGHGLSYTQFAYDNLTLSENSVAFDVTNIGQEAGAEIAQVYVGHRSEEVFHAAKSLAGFTKVYLQPQETRRVTIELTAHAFEFFNVKANAWEVEGGEYTVMVGASSRDIRLQETIVKESTLTQAPYANLALDAYFTANVQQVPNEQFEALLGRPIPEAYWDRSQLLTENDTISQMYYAKGFVARGVYRLLTHFLNKSIAKGEPNLNLFFNYNMTFRAMQKMTGGMVNHAMVQHILRIVNGHFFSGSYRVLREYFANQRMMKGLKQHDKSN